MNGAHPMMSPESPSDMSARSHTDHEASGSPSATPAPRKVVVVGSGLAGIAAALEARAASADVVLLEKQDESRRGGNTAVSGGAFLIPSADSDAARQDFVDSLMTSTKGQGNRELFVALAEEALDGIRWLQQLGAEFLPPYACAPPYRCSVHALGPGQFLGTPRLMASLNRALAACGVEIRFGMDVVSLLTDASRVTGVEAIGPEGRVTIEADAVVLAAGGYSGNREFLVAHAGEVARGLSLRGVDWLHGDGIELARHVGAVVRNTGGLESLHVAAVHPDLPGGGNPSRAIPYSIGINADGRRYVDESRGYVANGKAALSQPGQTIAIVFDADIATQPGPRTAMTTFRNMGLEIIAASTLEELARAIHVDADQLVATVAQFNTSITDGKALQALPPKTAWAAPVQTPPFFALAPCRPAITLTFGGVVIDRSARVCDAAGAPIAGLYAAGEMAGCLFHHDYLGGGSLTNCLVMGRTAGRHAAAPTAPIAAR